jgi:hypothetical protein
MKTLTAGVLLALVAAACLPPAGTRFETTVAQPDGSYPMPIVMGDQTGLVTAIEPATGDSSMAFNELPRVKLDPDDASAVLVTWITGACTDDTAVSLQRFGDGFRLRLDVHEGFGACMGMALFRGLRIRFSEPVPADSITATSSG